MKLLTALILFASSALADSYRVRLFTACSGRDVTVQAQSSSEARRVVMDIFPGAVVTGVRRSKSLTEISCSVEAGHDLERHVLRGDSGPFPDPADSLVNSKRAKK